MAVGDGGMGVVKRVGGRCEALFFVDLGFLLGEI